MAFPGSMPPAVVHEYLSTSLPPIIAGPDQPFVMGANFQGPPMQGQNFNGPNNGPHNGQHHHDNFNGPNDHHNNNFNNNYNNNNFNNNGKPNGNWNAPPSGPGGFAPNGVGPMGPNGRPTEVKQKTEIKVEEEEEKPHGIHKFTQKLHIHRKHK